jgi:integrase
VHGVLKRSIRQAQARDKVLRNVAELVSTPKGKPGRPSRAMTLEQATAMLEAAKASRLHAYVVVSLLTGIRTEEACALRWSHVVAWVDQGKQWQPVTEAGFDHERFAIYVWRSTTGCPSRRSLISSGTPARRLPRRPTEAQAGDHSRCRDHERHLQHARPGAGCASKADRGEGCAGRQEASQVRVRPVAPVCPQGPSARSLTDE